MATIPSAPCAPSWSAEMLECLQTRWVMNLTCNLTVAAACCRSFQMGVYAAASWTSGQLDGQNAWEPGCGRSSD